MAGLLENIMQGYSDRVLGQHPQNTAAQTATAYSRLQQAISADYDQQRTQFSQDPANKGKAWEMPSASERFNDQIHAMVLSGDPNLQKRGLELLTNPKDANDNRTAFQKDLEMLQQENPNLTAMAAYKMVHPGRAVTNVNVNTGQEKPIDLTDLQRLMTPGGEQLPFGTTPSEAKKLGAKVVQTQQQGKSGAGTDMMTRSMNELKDTIETSPKAVDSASATLRTQPGVVGAMANLGLSAAGVPAKPSDIQFTNATRMLTGQVTNLMNGASASEGERDYWGSLQPQLTDDVSTRKLKYNQMVDFAKSMAERAKQQGVVDVPDLTGLSKFNIDAPAGQYKSAGGVQFTVK